MWLVSQAEFEASQRQQTAETKIQSQTRIKHSIKHKEKHNFSFLDDFFDRPKFEAFFWEFCFLPKSNNQRQDFSFPIRRMQSGLRFCICVTGHLHPWSNQKTAWTSPPSLPPSSMFSSPSQCRPATPLSNMCSLRFTALWVSRTMRHWVLIRSWAINWKGFWGKLSRGLIPCRGVCRYFSRRPRIWPSSNWGQKWPLVEIRLN